MLLCKSIHIISMVAWFAGLFYLPRLFVYHSMNDSKDCDRMLQIMEYRLYYYIMNPSLVSTIIFGSILLFNYNFYGMFWIYIKILMTILLVIFHIYLGQVIKIFKKNKNKRSHKYYRIINEFPTLIILIIVPLVVIKPF